MLGLLGPNGAGKTTAVRILSTLVAAEAAAPAWRASTSSPTPPHCARRSGWPAQYAAVDELLTGEENLVLFGACTTCRRPGEARPRDRAARALRPRGRRPAARQHLLRRHAPAPRPGVATLVARPPVLFLDEPTTGLDPRSRLACGDDLDERRRGTTVLLTTQYLEEADRLADQIVRDRPRPGDRRGHRGGAQGPGRRRPPRGPARGRVAVRRGRCALVAVATEPPVLRDGVLRASVSRAPAPWPTRCAGWTMPASRSPTSRCGARRSTTSS